MPVATSVRSPASVRSRDGFVWSCLLVGGVGALVAAAAAAPDTFLTGRAPIFAAAAAGLPALVYAMWRGPKPGVEVVLALVAGFGWYPLAWVALWAAEAPDVPFIAWFEAVNANMTTVKTTTVLGMTVSETTAQGVSMDLHFQNAAGSAVALVLLSLIPASSTRCAGCGRVAKPRFLGWLSFDGTPPAIAGADALKAWLAAPTPLAPISAMPEGAAANVRLTSCAACGSAAVRGFLSVDKRAAGTTRDLSLSPEERARVAAG